MKWEYLATAPDQLTAEMWQELLQNEGISAMLQPRDAISFLGVSSMPCRLIVPEDLLNRAKEILSEHLEVEGS
jgi:hypothetical protein